MTDIKAGLSIVAVLLIASTVDWLANLIFGGAL